jgi:hypothetical protein
VGHFGGKGLAYILEKQNEFRLSVAFYQRLLDALGPKLLKQPSYILEIEYQNPDHHAVSMRVRSHGGAALQLH